MESWNDNEDVETTVWFFWEPSVPNANRSKSREYFWSVSQENLEEANK